MAALIGFILASWCSSAAWGQGAPAEPPKAPPTLKEARQQLARDQAALRADRKAEDAACGQEPEAQTPGLECDAAKVKVKASEARVKASREALRKAWKGASK